MKKAFKKLLSLVFCLLIAVIFVTGCETKFEDQGEVAKYYSFEDSKTVSLDLNERKFTLETGAKTVNGSYAFDGKVLTLTFSDKTSVTVDYQTNVLTFQYQGTQYTLYRELDYAVTFETNGGSSIPAATVQNGNVVAAPENNPVKSGYRFIGWYADSSLKQAYDFDTIITADTKIYARFETETDIAKEFDVTYETGVKGITFAAEKTLNGTIYNLPTIKLDGKNFLGWWVSDYENGSKLTYKYEELMVLKEDTTLYAVYEDNAPAVNIEKGKISWDSKGVNKQYAVNIVNADDLTSEEVFTKRVSQTSVDFDFTTVPTGNYLVSVTCGDYTGKAWYCNNGLARVSTFNVADNKLTWNKVENATNYLVTIECGISGHQHKNLSVGDVNEYDLSKCVMPKEGIKVVIKAEADNYVLSTSKAYVYYSALESVKNIAVDADKQVATWDAVKGATSYKVTILADEKQNTYTVEEAKIDLSQFTGNLKISVVPQAACMYADTTDYDYAKSSLVAPTNIKLLGFNVTWDEVVGAKSYVVKIGDKEFTSNTNSLALTQADCEAITEFKISIQACAEDAKNNSLFSKETVINKEGVNEVSFKNGVISWNAVPGTLKYAVKVDDSKVQIVENATEVKWDITSGKHTISVTVADEQGKYGDFYNTDVNVYALIFDACGGKDVEPMYLSKGDTIGTLPTTTLEGYGFIDWYVAPEGAQTSADKFDAKVFNYDQDVTVYASWQGNTYKVSFDYASYGVEDAKSQNVIYGETFTLPVVKANTELKAFIGWYSELNGQGEQYTDVYGNSIRKWRDYQDITLYAAYADIFTFNPINNGTAYSVSKGEGISYVTEIKIPTTYNDLPVTTVEASGFQGCSTLVNVYIPMSIQNVETGKMGPNGTGSCFQSCSKLENVYVYEVSGIKDEDVKYFSMEGVLIHINEFNGVEIAYFPYGTRGGTYTIPSQVTTIPANAFKSCTKLEEIIIPATIEKIDDSAFASCSKVTRITFLESEDPANEKELVIGANIFQYNSALISITLPSRLTSFNANIFASCSKLEEIKFEGSYSDIKYASVDGVVFNAEKTELLFFPRGKAGAYTIPVGVTTIVDSACESCKLITELNISGQVSYIGKNAFKSCTGITALNFQGQAGDVDLTIDESAFYGVNVITELALPANLVTLKKNAFGATTKLTKVSVNSVSSSINFESAAFGTSVTGTNIPTYYVTDLTISKDVEVFDVTGVFGAIKLVNVTVEAGNKNFASIDGVLYDSEVTRIVYYPTEKTGSFTLPATITSIGDRVFQSKTGITEITIGKNVIEIGESAFQSCTKLTKVVFEEGGTKELVIGKLAFTGCSVLADAQLPSRVTEIPEGCFKQCRKLTNFVIPTGVKRIGSEAFYYCDSLTTLTIPAAVTEIVETTSTLTDDKEARARAFDYCRGLTEFVVEEGNPNYQAIDGILYKNIFADGTNNIESVVLLASPLAKIGTATLPTNVSKIQNRAFFYSNGLTELKFAGDLTCECTIGSYAFYYCQTLEKVSFAHGVTQIGTKAFYSCDLLEEITIPNTLTYYAENAIYYCKGIKKVTFEEGGTAPLEFAKGTTTTNTSGPDYETYYYNAFYGATLIEELILPERTTVIGNYTFAGMKGLKKLVLPSTLKSVGTYAFAQCKNLEEITFTGTTTNLKTLPTYIFAYANIKSITIPSGIETLDTNCLAYCYNLESITIPASVTKINTYAFSQDKKLASVTFEEGSKLQTIGNYAFSTCGLKSIVIPQTVTTIGNSAFYKNTELDTITFLGSDTEKGCSLKTLGQYAFAYTGFTKFAFPYCGKDAKGVYNKLTIGTTTIKKVFQNCSQLTEIYLSQAVVDVTDLFSACNVQKITLPEDHENFKESETGPYILNKNGTSIVFSYGRLTGTITIPNGFTEICENAFKNQAEITKVIIPKSMKTIGKNAFTNCFRLEEVIFEDGCLVDSVGESAFMNCISLKEIELPEPLVVLPKGMFAICTSLEKVKLSSKTTTIGSYVFSYCSSLKEIDFPSTLTKIDQYSFQYTGLKEVTIPATLLAGTTGFGINSFAYCSSLEKVVISDGINIVPNNAFRGCTSLKELYIGNKVASIGNYAFDGCALVSVTIPASVTFIASSNSATVASYAFSNDPYLEEVIFEENSNCTRIGTYAFTNCPKLSKINLPSKLLSIGLGAFKGSALETVVIPTGVTQIGASSTTDGAGVFQDCTSLKSVTLNASLTLIGGFTFSGCTSLEEIEIPSKVTSIYQDAFSNTGLKKVTFKDCNVTTWGKNAFANNTQLTEVDLGKKLTKLGEYVFSGCTALESIEFPSTLTQINSSTSNYSTANAYFAGCTSLKNVTFKGQVKYIGANIFENCTSLESITLPATVTQIGNATFKGCTALKEFTVPRDCAKLGGVLTTGSIFEGCTSLEKVNFNTKLTYIGAYMFKDCTALTSISIPDTVTSIGMCFLENSGVTSVTLGSKVATISGLFNSSNVTNVTFNNNTKFSVYNNCAIVDTTGKIYSVFNVKDTDSFVMPENSTVNSNAFNGVTLDTLTLPESLTKIPSSGFVGLTAKKVILPDTVIEIGSTAFKASHIDSFDFGSGEKAIKYTAFDSAYVGEFLNTKSCISIDYNAFLNCKGFTSFEFGDKITTLTYGSFGNTDIEEVYLPDNITTFTASTTATVPCKGPFSLCANLKKAVLSANITTWGGYAFDSCTSLEKVELKGATGIATTAGQNMFKGCTALKEVILPEGMLSTASNMFNGCTSLHTINLPSTITTLQTNTFANCDLYEVKLPASITNVYAGVFLNNTNLTKVELNEGLLGLGAIPTSYGNSSTSGDGVFENCTSLATINIPSTCVTFAQKTFAGCTSIKSLYFNGDVLYVGQNCFQGWTKDQVVNFECYYYDTAGQFYHSEAIAANNAWDYNTNATFNFGVKSAN